MQVEKDYYKTLQIDNTASEDQIRKAYRSLVREAHPDVNDDPAAAENFKEIQEAYEILTDEN